MTALEVVSGRNQNLTILIKEDRKNDFDKGNIKRTTNAKRNLTWQGDNRKAKYKNKRKYENKKQRIIYM